jgi:hypothetical protein
VWPRARLLMCVLMRARDELMHTRVLVPQ